jgi:hypothetical protein
MPTRVLILLGSPNADDGTLSPIAQSKCQTGLQWLRGHTDWVLLPTGGFGHHFNRSSRPHWEYVHAWFVDHGVSEARLLHGMNSYNTLDDAVFSHASFLAAAQSEWEARVLTSRYHAERARWIFGRVFAERAPELLVAPDPRDDPTLDALARHEPRSLAYHRGRWEALLAESRARLQASPVPRAPIGECPSP